MDKFVEDLTICSICKGSCCKRNPGIYAGGEVKDIGNRIGKDLGIVIELIPRPEIAAMIITDFNELPEYLLNLNKAEHIMMLEAGLIDLTIDNFCDFLLALRPLGVNDICGIVGTKFIRIGSSAGNRCKMLGNSGCNMKPQDRPYQCKVLKPSPDFKCGGDENMYGYLGIDLAKSWIPYQIEMREHFKKYVSSLSAYEVRKAINDDDSLFASLLEERFLGMCIGLNGRITFNNN